MAEERTDRWSARSRRPASGSRPPSTSWSTAPAPRTSCSREIAVGQGGVRRRRGQPAHREHPQGRRRRRRLRRPARRDPPRHPLTLPTMADKTPIRMLHDRVLVAASTRRPVSGARPAASSSPPPLRWVTGGSPGPGRRRRPARPRRRARRPGALRPRRQGRGRGHGESYILLRERDVHAVAAERVDEAETGLYLWSRPCLVAGSRVGRCVVPSQAATTRQSAGRRYPALRPRTSPSACCGTTLRAGARR